MERLVEIRPQRGTYVFRYDITEPRRSAQKGPSSHHELVVARKYEEAELRVGKHVYNGYRTFAATLKAEDSVGPSPAISNFRR
jgi:hypothetical protein